MLFLLTINLDASAYPALTPVSFGPAIHLGARATLEESALTSSAPLPPEIFVARLTQDDNLIIAEVRLDRFKLSEGLIAYQWDDGPLYVPLSQIAASLDFPITIDLDAGSADGWFLAEDRRFSLSASDNGVKADGVAYQLKPNDVAVGFDDIYVRRDLLDLWFPIRTDYSSNAQIISIEALEPLPLQQRLERDKLEGRLAASSAGGQRQNKADLYETVETPYTLASIPFVDVSLDSDYTNSNDDPFSVNYSALATGDFLYTSAELSVNGSDARGVTDVRLSLGRQDPQGRLFGPIGATEFTVGDLFTDQLPLSPRSQRAHGVALSNFPLERTSEFDQVTVRGELPAGWDAELYRNDQLLAVQASRADGLYEFEDVPLLVGDNLLRVELYGPQGQRRTTTRRYVIGQGLTQPGEAHFSVSVGRVGELIDLDGSGDTTDENTEDGEIQGTVQVEYGLSRQLSVVAGFQHVPIEDDTQSALSAGVRLAALGIYTQVDTSFADHGGYAVEAATQLRAAGQNIFVRHTELSDFDISSMPEDTARETEVRVDGTIGGETFLRLPVSVDVTRREDEDGDIDYQGSQRASINAGPMRLSNTIDWSGRSDATDDWSGSTVVNTRIGPTVIRGSAGYAISPEAELETVAATVERRFGTDLSLRSTYSRRMGTRARDDVTVGVSWRSKQLSLGADLNIDSEGEFGAGISISTSLGREPRGGGWNSNARGLARTGAVSARAFLDRNGNQIFDPGDEPLPDVAFKQGAQATTNADGTVLLTGFQPGIHAVVELDERSLESPFWAPAAEGYAFVPRPGKVARIDFPIFETGEIDGTIYLKRGEQITAVSNAEVELIDKEGNVVQTIKSSFDGFYLFMDVRPGEYYVRIGDAQINRLGLSEPEPLSVELEGAESFVAGADIVLRVLEDGVDSSGQASRSKPSS